MQVFTNTRTNSFKATESDILSIIKLLKSTLSKHTDMTIHQLE